MIQGEVSPQHGRIVIMKFGGTSVATEAGRSAISARVSAALGQGAAPVVVVSAMGRDGAPYATDSLLSLVSDLPSDDRERDLLASVGEVISAVVVAHELRAAGIAARAYTGAEAGIVTDGVHGASTVTEVHTGLLVSALADAVVPVVCGFQGIAENGALTTLGRGGSDTTACALGVALGADEVEIYTDVDGVMTADPRACDRAGVLEVIGADELFQMARHGSRVVHTPAAELALASGLSVRVRNTYSDHPGTRVADLARYRSPSVATAVSHSAGIARIKVFLDADEGSVEHMRAQNAVYAAMAEAGVSLDMFTPVGDRFVFCVTESALDAACTVLGRLGFRHEITHDLSKVTLVGAGMHGVPGVMARMSDALANAGVNVIQTADSHTTISVLVSGIDSERAVQALHEGFALGE